uniref:ADP-ribosylation factor-like 9 n=1 Tax=Periophthalmus magnuspinnatus TaxID=409849 RepID=A0A3B4AUA1_9GOBI
MVGFRDVGALGASVVIAGGVAYFVWNYLSKQKTSQPPAKEAEKPTEESIKPIKQDGDGDVKASVQSTAVVKTVKPRGTQVLVLGLDGAGKTSLLRSFTNSWSGEEPQRTQGLNAVSISREDLAIEFLEIGGSAELRQYWLKYMSKALMLVYVVDASNPQVFPLAKTHLHEILATEPHLPLMVLANKQDCAGACTITDLHEALSLSQLGDRKLFVIGTYVTKDVEEPSSGVEDALEIIIETIQTQR